MSEFSLIEKFFSNLGKKRNDVLLGIGDDAAIVSTADLESLAVSVDTFIESVHFPADTDPYDIGWKSLAVNLSDMAAMGAKPRWVTLSLTIPTMDERWLEKFSQGFSDLAEKFDIQLIGGDTTRGSLSICVQILGSVQVENALRRDNAKIGDNIYVTGNLGDAALALKAQENVLPISLAEKEIILKSLNRPWPMVKEALFLSSYINAAIDVSDGLAQDLTHILRASGASAIIDVNKVPVSAMYRSCHEHTNENINKKFYDLALCGGDDYALCFTVAKNHEEKFLVAVEKLQLHCTCIGEVIKGTGLHFMDGNQPYEMLQKAYDHFSV